MTSTSQAHSPVRMISKEGANTLFVFFSSIAVSRDFPAFEYFSVSERINAHRIHIRDVDRCYYHSGLQDLTKDIYSTSEYLDKMIKQIAPKKVVFVGGSMGGFAAIMFATLTRSPEVIAFGPQTYLTPWLRYKNGNHRASKWVKRMYRKCIFKPKIWDLRKLLLASDFRPKLTIYYAANNRIDRTHMDRLRKVSGVKFIERAVETHGVKHLFPDKSELHEILVKACRDSSVD